MICVLWFLIGSGFCETMLIGISAFTAVTSAVAFFLEIYTCTNFECCNDRWIPANETALREMLASRIYGQPFASRILINAISNHWRSENPPKPLVMMLHGPTGVGKNHLAHILAETMFKKGRESRHVHYFTSSYHFRDEKKIKQHIEELQAAISSNSTLCDRQLYVFDESRRFPEKLLDSLVPFLDAGSPYSKNLRKSIFLFLYEGDEPVVGWAMELWKGRINREDLSLKQAEMKILPHVYNDESLKDSLLISKGFIDHHLPFLPLERSHIRLCIRDALLNLVSGNYNEDTFTESRIEEIIDLVEDEVLFYPSESPVFSTYGCKKVQSKLRALLLD